MGRRPQNSSGLYYSYGEFVALLSVREVDFENLMLKFMLPWGNDDNRKNEAVRALHRVRPDLYSRLVEILNTPGQLID